MPCPPGRSGPVPCIPPPSRTGLLSWSSQLGSDNGNNIPKWRQRLLWWSTSRQAEESSTTFDTTGTEDKSIASIVEFDPPDPERTMDCISSSGKLDSARGDCWMSIHRTCCCLVVSFMIASTAWCVYAKVNYGRVPVEWLWTGIPKVDLFQPELCNTRLVVPEMNFSHIWRPSPEWQRTCEEKNKHRYPWQWPHGRNWCWIGLKAMCHNHLKSHRSWSEFQETAFAAGMTAPLASERFNPLENPEVCDQPSNGGTREWTAAERSTAAMWFRSYVQVYVLNMPGETKRWNMIADRLRALKIQATRVYGVDMRAPNVLQIAKLAGWIAKEYNFSLAQETAYTKKHSMGSILGTLGCASAHFKAQHKAMEDGSPMAIVLEDDAWPVEDFVERVWSLVHEELPCDWEVVSLMSRCPFGKCVSPRLSRVQPDNNEPAWRCHQGVNWGMQGVMYRTTQLREVQRKWQAQVFNESRPHCMDVDVALASISDQVAFYAVPAGQDPGFLKETNHPSNRWNINVAGRSSTLEAEIFNINPNNMG